VARFPVTFDVEGERDRDGVIDRVDILERVQLPHAPEVLEDDFGVGQDGNWIGLDLGIGRTSGFELATEDKGGTLLGVWVVGRNKRSRLVSSTRPMPKARAVFLPEIQPPSARYTESWERVAQLRAGVPKTRPGVG
jgi:hypothetical protein